MKTQPIGEFSTPAEAARLKGTYDHERMQSELRTATRESWSKQRSYNEHGVGAETEADWRCLALRSPGGDPSRTDPGGPGPELFSDTKWMSELPYLREVLNSIPAPMHAVRLMALGPGTVGMTHDDPKYSPKYGVLRLHIPVVTNPDARTILDGQPHHWEPGEFWFGDFSRLHHVENLGSEHRTHLVMDTLAVPGTASLFPEEWREYFASGDVLFNRQPSPLREDEMRKFECDLKIPFGFTLWEEYWPLEGHADDEQANIRLHASGLALSPTDGQPIVLVHVGDGEFRFSGWSEERTIQLFPEGPNPTAVLRLRAGRDVIERVIPIRPTP